MSKPGLHEDSSSGPAPHQMVTHLNGTIFSPVASFVFHLSFLCLDYFLCGNRLKLFDLPTSQGLGRDNSIGQREGGGRKEGLCCYDRIG